jgi:hypothetical protein
MSKRNLQSDEVDSQPSKELVQAVRSGLHSIAGCIFPWGTFPGTDASGTHVASLTEAVMGLTSAVVQLTGVVHDRLTEISEAVERLENG